MDAWKIKEQTEEAIWALQSGQVVRALALADQLTTAVPDDAVVRAIRAQALLKSDAGEDAVTEARRAVELAPENEYAHSILGLAAWRANKLTLAQHSLERAIELSGRKPRLLVDYAWFMAYERGPRRGLEAATEAVEAAANMSTAWAALGLAQFRLHRVQEAEVSLRKALELDPNDPYAQSAMIIMLEDTPQNNEMLALAHLLEETPGTESIVADVREKIKQRKLAKRLVEREAMPPAVANVTISRWIWPALAAVMTGGLWLFVQPSSPSPMLLCTMIPLALIWVIYRIYGQ